MADRTLNSRERTSRIDRRSGAAGRGGFTLLEVVVAAFLSGLLMIAVYQAVDLHWKFSTAGREEIERSQLARAILKKIEIDIRSVVFQPPAPQTSGQGQAADEGSGAGSGTGGTGTAGTGTGGTGDAGTGSGSSSGSSTEQSEAVVNATSLDSAFIKATVGVMGSRDSLLLTISRPSRGTTTIVQDDQHLAPPRSDLRSVMYFLGVPGAGGLAGQAGNALAGNGGLTAAAEVQGLVRKEGDAMEMALADMLGDTSTLLLDSHLLAGEVNYLEFSYFGLGPGGLGWYEAWDSELYEMLPQAIRVTVGFYPPPGNTQILSRTYRLVVHVPLSEPYPPEGSY